MTKIFIFCALLVLTASCDCTKDYKVESSTPTKVAGYSFQKSFEAVYKASCELLDIPCNETLSLIKKRDIIREADMKDDAGDVLPEMPEYDEIVDFIWPSGYGKF